MVVVVVGEKWWWWCPGSGEVCCGPSKQVGTGTGTGTAVVLQQRADA